MPSESIVAALLRFAADVRRDRRANAAAEGDGTGLERLLTPRFHALLNALLHERMPEAPRLQAEYAKGGFGRPDLAFAR
jgi:hypothetical protein